MTQAILACVIVDLVCLVAISHLHMRGLRSLYHSCMSVAIEMKPVAGT